MRALIVMEGTLEHGRGPLFRRLGSMADLARRCHLAITCLAEPDATVRTCLEAGGVPYTVRPAHIEGWAVTNLDGLVAAIVADAREWEAELVVLDWEVWDLMRELSQALPPAGIRFATVVHAVPFLNAPAHPSGDFARDVDVRLSTEPDDAVASYIVEHAHEANEVLRRIDVLAPNRCVLDYLAGYFPGVLTRLVEPGYAVEIDEIDMAEAAGEPVTFAFMAKLVREKGTHEVLAILADVCADPGFASSRLVVIGSFEGVDERHEFLSVARRLGVEDRLELTGWLNGREKYGQLKRASVFIYPPAESDTFSICLMEALACGLPAVCADVPFIRSTYATAAVERCRPGDIADFAQTAVRLARHGTAGTPFHGTRDFAAPYGSWRTVALAEADTYGQVLGLGAPD